MNNLKTIVLTTDDLELFRVIPMNKRPAVFGGYKSAKKNFDVVRTYIHGYNVGFKMEPNFITIDMDEDETKGYHGIQVIKDLEKKLGVLPHTYSQSTPRGGIHKVFLADGFKNAPMGKLTPAVDLKYNGYILFNGSYVFDKDKNINGYYRSIDGDYGNGKLFFSALPQSWITYIESSIPKVNSTESKSYDYKPVVIEGDFKKMYETCLFVKHCVDDSAILSEPEWHLFARLLNQFENGEDLFVEYSKNHAEFNLEKSKEKFLRGQKYPISCKSINRVSDACKNCRNIKKG